MARPARQRGEDSSDSGSPCAAALREHYAANFLGFVQLASITMRYNYFEIGSNKRGAKLSLMAKTPSARSKSDCRGNASNREGERSVVFIVTIFFIGRERTH